MLISLAPSVAVSQETEAGNGRENPVVVIGFSGLLWRDITQENTPNLYQFLESSAGANMVVRTVDETTCPSEGWLTIGAGQRAIDPTNGCAQIGARGWDSLVQANLASSYRAELGLLGDTLAGESLAAIGPGAQLALTDSSGNFEGEYADLAPLPGSVEGTDPYALDTATGDAAAAFTNVANSDLVAIDLGSVRYPGDELNPVGAPAEEYRPRGAIDKFLAAFKGTGAPPPRSSRRWPHSTPDSGRSWLPWMSSCPGRASSWHPLGTLRNPRLNSGSWPFGREVPGLPGPALVRREPPLRRRPAARSQRRTPRANPGWFSSPMCSPRSSRGSNPMLRCWSVWWDRRFARARAHSPRIISSPDWPMIKSVPKTSGPL